MPWMFLLKRCVVAAKEEAREVGQILDAIAQRRHLDRHDIEPVEEVLAELPFLDRLVEIDVGRGDETQVGLDRLHAADALDLAFLDRAQQLGLQLVAKIADLVEEQRAAGGELELADLLPDRAGERPFLVSEERALDQLLRNRGEVDRDKRRIRSPARTMDQPGEELFSCAAFAEDEHGHRRGRDSLHALDDFARRRTWSDDELAFAAFGDVFPAACRVSGPACAAAIVTRVCTLSRPRSLDA